VLTLRNPGDQPVTVTSVSAPAGGGVSLQPLTVGTVIPPRSMLDRTVTFAPVAGGLTATNLLVATDKGGSRTVRITAQATPPPRPPTYGWRFNGTARLTGSTVELTTAGGGQTGSAFSPDTITTGYVEAEFRASVGGGSGADGLALALADGTVSPATALGGGGGGLGWAGTSGIAVALDTYRNGGDPATPFVGVATGAGPQGLTWVATAPLPGLRTGPHRVRVVATAQGTSVWVDGVPALSTTAAAPRATRVGFTAATGGLTDRHAVDQVVIRNWPAPPAPVAAPAAGVWPVNGSAQFEGSRLVLTPPTPGVSGSSWSPTTMASGSLHASFDATIDQGSGADGMAFVLADASTPTTALAAPPTGVLGWPGGDGGVAVVLDTWHNGSEPGDQYIGVATANSGTGLALRGWATDVAPLTNGTHHIDVHVVGGELRVAVDGVVVITTPVVLPPQVRLGFTGATGGFTDRHSVSGVTFAA
jgi:hypothetical protein